eukprot:g36522.t1
MMFNSSIASSDVPQRKTIMTSSEDRHGTLLIEYAASSSTCPEHRNYATFFVACNMLLMIIESLQRGSRPFSPTSLHRSSEHSTQTHPLMYIPEHYRQFSMANSPSLHIFGLWEETGA